MPRMFRPFEAFIGLRYVRAKRRNHFISFISLTSMIGVALGVTALIAVLSVMNGFEKELKDRILGMASHATVMDYSGSFQNWRAVADEIARHPEIEGVAPFYSGEGMAVRDQKTQGTVIQGILPEEEPKVSDIRSKMIEGDFNALRPGEFGVIIGTELAGALGVYVGDKITLVVPEANVTPAGVLPRMKRFTIVGLFEVGMHEYDSALVLVHIEDALRLFRAEVRAACGSRRATSWRRRASPAR